MNGIIEISDKSEDSQLSTIKDSIDEIIELLPKYHTPMSAPSELDVFERIIKGQVIRQNDSSKYFKKCLEKVKIVMTHDKLEIIKIYTHLSLDDISPIISHWGDTTSEQVKDDGKTIRMDLRWIACETPIEQNKIFDTAVAELAPKVLKSKYYNDQLKTVLASKSAVKWLVKEQ
ncbi:hypothetical protein BDF20DRAFT_1005040 [Mycotypha africana]|uniref:uncharacterized protein n=1 Tax=Mycotypha africana TaxID=64632 RepID=UPI002301612D|nr:uncharacterized protein BDF20DRAFT_1005040 [Mycotypha africana]KAI8967187.1 hypothetical protein BDF20DRAFT_1005040 [Mycotypha africana]